MASHFWSNARAASTPRLPPFVALLSPIAQAEAEFAPHSVEDKTRKLHGEGLGDAEVLAQRVALLLLLLRGVLAQQIRHRVADKLEQHQSDECHRQHHDHGLQQAAKTEDEHQCPASE